MKMKLKRAICSGVGVSAILCALSASASDFTIVDGQTEITTQILDTPGDVGTVEAGGVIDVLGGHAIEATASGVNINNAGTLTGGGGAGISVLGQSNNSIINSGLSSGGSYGIAAYNLNNISNSGTSSGGVYGIAINDYNTITNTGIIVSTAFHGLSAGHFNTISNSGTIMGGITGLFGVDNNTIINSGTIVGGEAAVRFSGTGNTLNLLSGSNIQGNLDLGSGNTLNIGRGLSATLGYSTTGAVTIKTGGMPSYYSGSTIYAVDPTGFSATEEIASDLTGLVAGATEERMAAPHSGEGIGRVIWAKGFGSYRGQKANGGNTGFGRLIGGLVTGIESTIGNDNSVGLFAGAASSRMETDSASQSIDNNNYFAGLYANLTGGGAFLKLSASAGLADYSSYRIIANNLVGGGIEHAKADYKGVFISPSATFGSDFKLDNGRIVTPSLRVRYTGLFLNSYDEIGSTADLSVDGRSVNIFEVRGQLAYRIAPVERQNGVLETTLRMGADGIFSSAGNINASLLGNSLDFSDINGSDTALRGFVGVNAHYTVKGGASFHAGAELGYDSKSALNAQTSAEISIPF